MSTAPNRPVSSRLLISLFLLASWPLLAAKPFDIPAQPAPDALALFIRQSGSLVIFNQAELKSIRTNALLGSYEPADAISVLVKDTGLTAREREPGRFVVTSSSPAKPGSVDGQVKDEKTGRPVSDARVSILGTTLATTTSANGRFSFGEVPVGVHVLGIAADGMQNTKVTDVELNPGTRLTLSPIFMPAKKEGAIELETYSVRAKRNDVVELDPYAVEGRKEKPFTTNMDIPRTINDAQAYTIFNAKTIDRSGAISVEDFLKNQLTMNTSSARPGIGAGAGASVYSSTNSNIDLRGIGADKTLILVNGRRRPSNTITGNTLQPDLNPIPLALIDRIEVLPSSASGIYGGSAIGGVINVILKREFTGGEVRFNYGGPLDTDAPNASVSANYGITLEGGRTQVRFGASWSDGKELTLGERRDRYLANLDRILRNAPNYFNVAPFGFASERVNVTPASSTQTTLTLKNGTVLTTPRTFVGAGISPGSSLNDRSASLAANVGQFSRGMADTNDLYGSRARLSLVPRNLTYTATIRREMRPWLEAFSDFSYTDQNYESAYNYFGASPISVPANALSNPFTTAVSVRAPSTVSAPMTRAAINRAFTVGALLKLPATWTAVVDYSRTSASSRYSYFVGDSTSMTADLVSGALNPFVDTVQYPLALDRYLVSVNSAQANSLDEYAIRANGPLSALPWGAVNLTIGLGRREGKTGTQTLDSFYPQTPNNSLRDHYLSKGYRTDSGYIEALVPLVPRDRFELVNALDLQVAGRTERFEADTGTTGIRTFYQRTPPTTTILGANRSGAAIFDKVSYDSKDITFAFRYQPSPDWILRASRGTAFLPPTPAQLAPSNSPSVNPTVVVDPTNGNNVSVTTIGGGNPSLKPQNSISKTAGIVWEPRTGSLRGFRVNADYYNIQQFDFITAPTAQVVVSNPDLFPGRMTRNASGVITQVDVSNANLYRRESEGIDLTLDYTFKTGMGLFNARETETIMLHNLSQYSLTLPAADGAGFPSDGAGIKRKRTVSLTWERSNWTAGWNLRYFGAYGQNGAPNSPQVIRTPASAATWRDLYILPQGSDTVRSQAYHDLFFGYAFRHSGEAERVGRWRGILDGLQVQVGVRNIFDRAPPLDAISAFNNYYTSQFGDLQLRTYWVSVRKQF